MTGQETFRRQFLARMLALPALDFGVVAIYIWITSRYDIVPKVAEKGLMTMVCADFVDEVSRDTPAPGGGSAAGSWPGAKICARSNFTNWPERCGPLLTQSVRAVVSATTPWVAMSASIARRSPSEQAVPPEHW